MRLTWLAALPVALSLLSFTAAFSTDHEHSLNGREYIDALATRDLLTDLSTRDLLDELTERAVRTWKFSGRCTQCGKWILVENKKKELSPIANGGSSPFHEGKKGIGDR